MILKGTNGLSSIRKFFDDPMQNMSRSSSVRRSAICQQRRLKWSSYSFQNIHFSRFLDRFHQKRDVLADFDSTKMN